jgi:hypothetical protein
MNALIAKLHKISERTDSSDRLKDKDGLDVLPCFASQRAIAVSKSSHATREIRGNGDVHQLGIRQLEAAHQLHVLALRSDLEARVARPPP